MRACATPNRNRTRWNGFRQASPCRSARISGCERQTLRRLPQSGDILFTVRVHVDPIAAFSGHASGRALARALHDQLASLSGAQLAYKGIVEARERLLAALLAIAQSSSS